MRGRNWHVYVGTFFAPLLIYFALSGAWQTLRLNDLPRNENPGAARKILHALSNPHRESLLPGKNPKTDSPSILFQGISFLMALGFILTAFLGIQMAFTVNRRRKAVTWCLIAGVVVPVIFLFLS